MRDLAFQEMLKEKEFLDFSKHPVTELEKLDESIAVMFTNSTKNMPEPDELTASQRIIALRHIVLIHERVTKNYGDVVGAGIFDDF